MKLMELYLHSVIYALKKHLAVKLDALYNT